MNKKSYIWTPEIAYAIGLIVTDGNLSSDKRHISLTSSDKDLLYTFRKCLNLQNKITKNPNGTYSKKQSYRVQFGNVSFYNWLVSIGLMPRKTFLINELKIPDEFMADFLRGHLDGDGSIIVYTDSYNIYKEKRYTYQRLYTVFNSGSYNHIKWIHSTLQKTLNIRGGLNSWLHNKSTHPLWKLKFAKNDSFKLLRWLYHNPNVPCLNRKRKIAEEFMKNIKRKNAIKIDSILN